MITYTQSAYEAARTEFLRQCAYMTAQNDKFAQERGGVEALSPADARIYHGRQNRILALVLFHDRAQELIREYQRWTEDLIAKVRSAKNRADDEDNALRYELARVFPQYKDETAREHQRALSITTLQLSMPQLF